MPNLTHAPVSNPEPRRLVRDRPGTPETLASYRSRTGQPASAETTVTALAYYSGELQADLAIAEIFAAGWDACVAAMTAPAKPHLQVVS